MLKILKFFIAAWIIFAFVAVANNGGYKIRAIEGDAHKAVSKTISIVADKADNLKEQADTTKEKVKNITGVKKEVAQTEIALPEGKKSKVR
jgi:hypothetical protein